MIRESRTTNSAVPEIQNKLIATKSRLCIIIASLLALFLGALDALIMSAAMPTIVAELGGLHLYSWVYSTYLLSRAIALPVFGKLADLFKVKILFMISIGIFLVSSIMAGFSLTMLFLIICRVIQGIGCGGIFALVYIVLADITPKDSRGKTLSLAGVIWGVASVLGPSLGGFIVTFFSWRWIFFINIPMGIISLIGIAIFLIELREKKRKIFLDFAGIFTLSILIMGLLTVFLLVGRGYYWLSPQIIGLVCISAVSGSLFYVAEKRAKEPILPLGFFENKRFSFGNASAFFSSFAIFSLFAFAPIFIQGALGQTAMAVGMAMLVLSLAWSLGALVLGYGVHRFGKKKSAVLGAFCMVAGSALTLSFTPSTSMLECLLAFVSVGIGMGFVSLSTLLIVQEALDLSDLGIATASNQFARTLGGTVGVGICGGILTAELAKSMDALSNAGLLKELPFSVLSQTERKIENLFRPEVQNLLSPDIQKALQKAVSDGTLIVFWGVLLAALVCLYFCLMLPKAEVFQTSNQSP